MGYYLTYCFNINALAVIFAVVFFFWRKFAQPAHFTASTIVLVHAANPEQCYFVPCAYFLLRGCTEL